MLRTCSSSSSRLPFSSRMPRSASVSTTSSPVDISPRPWRTCMHAWGARRGFARRGLLSKESCPALLCPPQTSLMPPNPEPCPPAPPGSALCTHLEPSDILGTVSVIARPRTVLLLVLVVAVRPPALLLAPLGRRRRLLALLGRRCSLAALLHPGGEVVLAVVVPKRLDSEEGLLLARALVPASAWAGPRG